jgi:hypothetical protein
MLTTLSKAWERKHRALYSHYIDGDNEFYIVIGKRVAPAQEEQCEEDAAEEEEMQFEEIPFNPPGCQPTACPCAFGGAYKVLKFAAKTHVQSCYRAYAQGYQWQFQQENI